MTGLPSRWSPVELGERYGILVLWAVIIVVFSVLRPNTFATASNFQTIFGTQAVQVVITLGLSRFSTSTIAGRPAPPSSPPSWSS